MTLVLASGDHHWNERSRFAECRRIHKWIAEQVAKEKPACFLSGGDVFDGASTPIEREAVADWLTEVAETCPVLIARGNHDRGLDTFFMRRLATKHPIVVEERCGVHVIGGLKIAAVAWPNRASVAAMLGQPLTGTQIDEVAVEALRNVLRGLGQQKPDLLLGHWMISGAVTSVGQQLVGAELEVGLADLALAGAKMTIASHIHAPQAWEYKKQPIAYCGSPYRTSYGETERKSIIYADVTAKGVEWKRYVTPCTDMVLLTADWTDGKLVFDGKGPLKSVVMGAECRLRYRVPADQRDAARAAVADVKARMLGDGAENCKVEEQLTVQTRARTPEIATAKTLADKLDVLWKSRGVELDAQRRARVLQKLSAIEEGA